MPTADSPALPDAPRRGFAAEPFLVVGMLAVLCCLPFAAELPFFRVDSEMADLLAGDQRSLTSYQDAGGQLATSLGADSVAILVSVQAPDAFAPETVQALRDVGEALGQRGGVFHAFSLAGPWVRPRFHQEGHFSVFKLPKVQFYLGPLVPDPPASLSPAERDWALAFPFFRNLLFSADGRHAMIFAFAKPPLGSAAARRNFCTDIDECLRGFEATIRERGGTMNWLSFPHAEHETLATLRNDLLWQLPLSLVVLLGVLLWTFRGSLRLVLYGMIMTGLGALVVLPLAPMMGYRISPFTSPLYPLLAGVQLALVIHVGTAHQNALRAGRRGMAALGAVLDEILRGCLFATVMAVVGMISLAASDVRPTREFGLIGAAAVTLLFVTVFGPGILLLRLFGDGKAAVPRPDRDGDWAGRFLTWVEGRRAAILWGTTAAVVVTVAGVCRIRTDIRIVEFLSPRSITRQSLEELNRAYGGLNFAKLEVDTGAPGGVSKPEVRRFLLGLQEFAQGRPGVSMVYSAAGLVQAAGDVARVELPWTASLPRDFVDAMVLAQFQQPAVRRALPLLDSLYDEPLQRAWLVLRTRDMPSRDYLELIEAVVAQARRTAPKGVKVTARDAQREIMEADRRIVESQVNSTLYTLGLTALMLWCLWRSWALALLAMAVNAVPVGLVVAVQGFTGVPLNSITIMVSAIVFGIAVDDTIHFITHWREERARGSDSRTAVLEALRVKGRAIVFTSVILIGLMGVFLVSSFPPVRSFGWLSALGFVCLLASALLLLPLALARWERGEFAGRSGQRD